MQEMLLILSRCQASRKSPSSLKTYYKFHFKGFYIGLKIKEIHVFPHNKETFEKGRDYLLWVRHIAVKDLTLEVELLKHKEIK
jgi:hypothetical protein